MKAIPIWARYKRTGKTEQVDTARTEKTAAAYVKEYQMAFGADFEVWAGPKRRSS